MMDILQEISLGRAAAQNDRREWLQMRAFPNTYIIVLKK
jgi:hypothetical protein